MGAVGPRGGEAGTDDAGPDGAEVVAAREREAWAVLASVRGLGPVGLASLLARYGSGAAILAEAASPGGPTRLADTPPMQEAGSGRRPVAVDVGAAVAEAALAAPAIVGRIRAAGLAIVTVEDPAYPARLAGIELPPHVLFVLGEVAALDAHRAVAVVGTRRPTTTGRAVATRIAAALAGAGATVVSGLAIGIDGAAHAATLEAGGVTIAVIGSGHAALFPRAHGRLADMIAARGGAVVSESPPDMPPGRGTFPRRNRVISGLSEATVVVEAPARSGALITASWALEQGRECFLVPGPIDERASAGCLSFLREYPDSARIVAGVPQLLDDLGLVDRTTATARAASATAEAALVELGGTADRIGRELVAGRVTVDELVAATGHPVATVLGALTLLEGRGLVRSSYGRYRPAGALATAAPGRRALRAAAGRC